MTFENRLDQLLKDRGVSKTALAKNIGIPETTFYNRRMKTISSWKFLEFNKMVKFLRLTDEEVRFLTVDVE